MYNEIKERHRQLKNGQYVRLIKPVTNNDITFNVMERGKIIHKQNNVEADIWMFDEYGYKDKLNLHTDYHKNGRFTGVVLNIKADSFAVKFNYGEHDSIIISEEKALQIPFFDGWEDKKIPSNMYKNINGEMVRQYEYLLIDVIEYIEDAFTEWVRENLETREVTNDEKESGEIPEEFDWVFTDKSQDKFTEMQDDLELKFAQLSGFYHHFLGGTIED